MNKKELEQAYEELSAKYRRSSSENLGKIIDHAAKLLDQSIKWGAMTLIAWFFFGTVTHLSITGLGEAVAALSKADCVIFVILGIFIGSLGIIYGLNQRRMRKETVAHIYFIKEALERRLDPDRTSSKLTPEGETNPGDS